MLRPLVAMALVTMVSPLAACHTEQTRINDVSVADGPVYCTVMADAVHKDDAGTSIVAPGRFRCDRPGVTSLALTVAMQQRGDGGLWTTIATQQFTAAGADTTRDRSEAQRTRAVGVACAAGVYRTVVSGSTTSEGETVTYAMNGPTTTNPCSLSSRR